MSRPVRSSPAIPPGWSGTRRPRRWAVNAGEPEGGPARHGRRRTPGGLRIVPRGRRASRPRSPWVGRRISTAARRRAVDLATRALRPVAARKPGASEVPPAPGWRNRAGVIWRPPGPLVYAEPLYGRPQAPEPAGDARRRGRDPHPRPPEGAECPRCGHAPRAGARHPRAQARRGVRALVVTGAG